MIDKYKSRVQIISGIVAACLVIAAAYLGYQETTEFSIKLLSAIFTVLGSTFLGFLLNKFLSGDKNEEILNLIAKSHSSFARNSANFNTEIYHKYLYYLSSNKNNSRYWQIIKLEPNINISNECYLFNGKLINEGKIFPYSYEIFHVKLGIIIISQSQSNSTESHGTMIFHKNLPDGVWLGFYRHQDWHGISRCDPAFLLDKPYQTLGHKWPKKLTLSIAQQ